MDYLKKRVIKIAYLSTNLVNGSEGNFKCSGNESTGLVSWYCIEERKL